MDQAEPVKQIDSLDLRALMDEQKELIHGFLQERNILPNDIDELVQALVKEQVQALWPRLADVLPQTVRQMHAARRQHQRDQGEAESSPARHRGKVQAMQAENLTNAYNLLYVNLIELRISWFKEDLEFYETQIQSLNHLMANKGLKAEIAMPVIEVLKAKISTTESWVKANLTELQSWLR